MSVSVISCLILALSGLILLPFWAILLLTESRTFIDIYPPAKKKNAGLACIIASVCYFIVAVICLTNIIKNQKVRLTNNRLQTRQLEMRPLLDPDELNSDESSSPNKHWDIFENDVDLQTKIHTQLVGRLKKYETINSKEDNLIETQSITKKNQLRKDSIVLDDGSFFTMTNKKEEIKNRPEIDNHRFSKINPINDLL